MTAERYILGHYYFLVYPLQYHILLFVSASFAKEIENVITIGKISVSERREVHPIVVIQRVINPNNDAFIPMEK